MTSKLWWVRPTLLAFALVAAMLITACGLTEDEARRVAEEQVQSALSALPTPTRAWRLMLLSRHKSRRLSGS